MKTSTLNLNEIGIACDLDDTVSETLLFWTNRLINKFGKPSHLTTEDIIKKYGYVQYVPFWSGEKVHEYTEKLSKDQNLYKSLKPIKEAKYYLPKVHQIIPISLYLTARPELIKDISKEWINQIDEFPNAYQMHRPESVEFSDSNLWKANILQEMYPTIQGIIDDNTGLLKYLPKDYPGYIFAYTKEKVNHPRAIQTSTWEKIYENIKIVFQ